MGKKQAAQEPIVQEKLQKWKEDLAKFKTRVEKKKSNEWTEESLKKALSLADKLLSEIEAFIADQNAVMTIANARQWEAGLKMLVSISSAVTSFYQMKSWQTAELRVPTAQKISVGLFGAAALTGGFTTCMSYVTSSKAESYLTDMKSARDDLSRAKSHLPGLGVVEISDDFDF